MATPPKTPRQVADEIDRLRWIIKSPHGVYKPNAITQAIQAVRILEWTLGRNVQPPSERASPKDQP